MPWAGIGAGLLAWGLAGGTTLPHRSLPTGIAVWAAAYGLAFWLGALWGDWFEGGEVVGVHDAGFVGHLLGWGLGAMCGAFVSAMAAAPRRRLVAAGIVSAVWAVSFMVAGYIALALGLVLGTTLENAFGHVAGDDMMLTIGWIVGAALSSVLASICSLAAWRKALYQP